MEHSPNSPTAKNDLTTREIWVRGLTVSDRGKTVVIDGHTFFLRGVEHLGSQTHLDVVTRITLDGKTPIGVRD